MDRRQFLRNTLIGLSGMPLTAELAANEALVSNPFRLGVASGDVSDSSSVLWTRLAPEPEKADGGMPQAGVLVAWELSLDRAMSKVIRRGQAMAVAELGHSVHVELEGLESARDYWYRFSVGGYHSRIGRTRTLPGQQESPERARFVTASCQNFTHGHFVAYRHMVKDAPDFVIHLGDYIYDTAFGETFRKHPSENPPQTLGDFRRWHALYKSDRDLQAAHAAIPFFLSIDNHDAIEDNDPSKAAIRAAAYQAWYEHMPVRGYGAVGANAFDIHRCISVGSLAQICLLDSRQFRDKRELCTEDYDPGYGFGNYRERCQALFADERSMLGAAQERWLIDKLTHNSAAWNVIASPGPFLPFSYRVDGKDRRYIGAWDSYPANRQRIAAALAQSGEGHPLILSGDVHSFWAIDGAATTEPEERFPVLEFVTSSISANWPPALAQPVSDNLRNNPQVRFYDPAHRGYLLHELTAKQWQTTARGIDDVHDEQSGISTVARFTVNHGEAGFSRTGDQAAAQRQ
jgi:alkaline phosphatase D